MKFRAALLLLGLSGTAPAVDLFPETVLRPVYQALAAGDLPAAYRALVAQTPDGEVQQQAWLAVADVLQQEQCGLALPIRLPEGLTELQVTLVQRDYSVRRGYHVRIRLHGASHPYRISLRSPQDQQLVAGLSAATEEQGYSELEGEESSVAFQPGRYLLTLEQAEKRWQAALLMTRTFPLATLSFAQGSVQIQPPPQEAHCPPPRQSLALMTLPDYQLLWQSSSLLTPRPVWPSALPDRPLWASITLTQRRYQGELILELQQRIAGPKAQF